MARIFIAIRFNDELKKVLVALQDGLGSFPTKAGVIWCGLLQALNTVGLLRSIRPMPTSQVAKAMIAMVKEQREGIYILEPKDLWRI